MEFTVLKTVQVLIVIAIKRCDYFQARLLGQIQVNKCMVRTIELKHCV